MSQNGVAAQKQENHDIAGPLGRLDSPTDSEEAAVKRGQEAWHRLRCSHTWEDWKDVGAAHRIGRIRAMHEAGVNRPTGHRYHVIFASWLKHLGFENLDKGDRSRLFVVMDHIEEIDAWRATLTSAERLRLNHPSATLRKWRSMNAPSRTHNSRLSPIEKCRQEIIALKQENFRLRRECERLVATYGTVSIAPKMSRQ